MYKFTFSEDYLSKLNSLKSLKYNEKLFSCLHNLKEYMLEEEYHEVSDAIEDIVELKFEGNIITSHSYGTFSEWLIKDSVAFIQTMVEDLQDWFMFDSTPLQCRLFCIGIHIDDYEITDDDLEQITYGIMINFIENGIPCPDVVLLPTIDYKKKMDNGYFILGLK